MIADPVRVAITKPGDELRAAIVGLKHDLTMRGIAGLIAFTVTLFTALHLWPPHG